MKILVVYFSRTNTTKKVAEALGRKLGATVEAIIDKKDWSGPIGWINAGRYVAAKKSTEIEEAKNHPAEFDLVVIGTPVWVGTMSVAVKKYIEVQKDSFKQVAFFTTQGSSKRQRVFDDLAALTGKKPKSELMLATKDVRLDNFEEKLNKFVAQLK